MMFCSKFSGFFLLTVLSSFFLSCQSEIIDEQYSAKETISKTTPLTTYIERIVMQKTKQDNIIDKTDCFMVKYPYKVAVNKVDITINSASDLVLVENNISGSTTDADDITIYFPITVIFKDYKEVTLYSLSDYTNLIHDCAEQLDDFPQINCITFNYPMSINRYDSNNQIVSFHAIQNDQALYYFMINLENNQFIAIGYPISVVGANGVAVNVTNNVQLENIIKETLENCSGNTHTTLELVEVLTSGVWTISYFYDDQDQTSMYGKYQFYFKNDYSVKSIHSGISKDGTWLVKKNNGVSEFKIDIDEDLLNKLDEEWEVFEYSTSELRLRDPGDDSLETDYLYFSKIK